MRSSQTCTVLVGGRDVAMRAHVYVRRHFGARTIMRALLKDLPPAQLCEGNVSCTVDVGCDKEISSSGWEGGYHCKVVESDA